AEGLATAQQRALPILPGCLRRKRECTMRLESRRRVAVLPEWSVPGVHCCHSREYRPGRRGDRDADGSTRRCETTDSWLPATPPSPSRPSASQAAEAPRAD